LSKSPAVIDTRKPAFGTEIDRVKTAPPALGLKSQTSADPCAIAARAGPLGVVTSVISVNATPRFSPIATGDSYEPGSPGWPSRRRICPCWSISKTSVIPVPYQSTATGED
jgi:hypothetical protein